MLVIRSQYLISRVTSAHYTGISTPTIVQIHYATVWAQRQVLRIEFAHRAGLAEHGNTTFCALWQGHLRLTAVSRTRHLTNSSLELISILGEISRKLISILGEITIDTSNIFFYRLNLYILFFYCNLQLSNFPF